MDAEVKNRRRRSAGPSKREPKEEKVKKEADEQNAAAEPTQQDLAPFSNNKAALDQAINKITNLTNASESLSELKDYASASDNKYVQAFVENAKSMEDVSSEVQAGRQALSAAARSERADDPSLLDKLAAQDNPYAKELANDFRTEKQQDAVASAFKELDSELSSLSPSADAKMSLSEAIEKVSKWEAAGLSKEEMSLLNEKLDNPHIDKMLEASSTQEALQDAKVALNAMQINEGMDTESKASLQALNALSDHGNEYASTVSSQIADAQQSSQLQAANAELDADMSNSLQEHQQLQLAAIASADFLAAKEELNEAMADVQQVSLSYEFKDGTVIDQVVTYDAHERSEKEALAEAITDISQAYQIVGQTANDLANIEVSSSTGTSYALDESQVALLREQIKEVEQVTNFQVAENAFNSNYATEDGAVDLSKDTDKGATNWRAELEALGGAGAQNEWSEVQSNMEADKQFTAIPLGELLKEELIQAGMDKDTIAKADAIAQSLSQERDSVNADTFLVVHASGPALAVLTDQEGVDRQTKPGDLIIESNLVQDMLNGIDRSVKDFKDQLPNITESMTTLDVYTQLERNTLARMEKEGVPTELMEALTQYADKAQLNAGVAPDPVITETFVADQINNKWGEGMSEAQVLRESLNDLATVQETAVNKDHGHDSSNDRSNEAYGSNQDLDKEADNDKHQRSKPEQEESSQAESQAEMEMSAE